MTDALDRARLALEGLSVADAVGEKLLHAGPVARQLALEHRTTPAGRWMWTDDTAMAISIVEVLSTCGGIEPDRLARLLDAVVEHAARSAAPTHSHPDGVAGAIAVAVAAACVFAGERDPRTILDTVIARTPPGPTREGIMRTVKLLGAESITVAAEVGNGSRVISSDTVPFAIWCAVSHLDDFAGACWACIGAGGDIDTTCAMAGGIIVGATGLAGIPAEWREAREALPVV